jgi:hypothetical protein
MHQASKILYAEEFQRPDFNEMLSKVWDLLMEFGSMNKIHIDGANPSFIKSLKIKLGCYPYRLNI